MLTSDEVNPACKSLEHVPGLLKSVYAEAESHEQQTESDDGKGTLCSSVICRKTNIKLYMQTYALYIEVNIAASIHIIALYFQIRNIHINFSVFMIIRFSESFQAPF